MFVRERLRARLWRYRSFLPVFLLALTMPVPISAFVPRSIRLLVFNGRYLLVLAVIAASALVAISHRRYSLRGYLAKQRLPTLFGVSMVFPAYYAATSLWKPVELPSLVLYVLWSQVLFLWLPLLLWSEERLVTMVRTLLAANLVAWLVPVVLSLFVAPDGEGSHAVLAVYGYSNPDYFAQLLQVVFAAVLFLAGVERVPRLSRRWWLGVVILVATVHGALSVSGRNVVVFMAVMSLSYVVMRRARRPLVAALGMWGAFLGFVFLISGYLGTAQIDAFSSGRLGGWETLVGHIRDQEYPLPSLLFGVEELPTTPFSRYDPLRDEKAFDRYHIDNTYLEMILTTGVCGLLAFFGVFALVLAVATRLLAAGRVPRAPVLWAISVIIGISVQSAVVTTVPTFGNPLSLLFATAVVVAIWPPRLPRGATC